MRNRSKGRILPKISTMPRQKTEAAAFLEIYKLEIEKKRLQQELQSIDERRQQILTHLATLTNQVENLEDRAQQLRSTSPEAAPAHSSPTSSTTDTFDMLFLEY
jgi:chromosome segregation ATPase